MKSERNLRHVEIIQKPSRLAKLVDMLEFREIYSALKHKVDIDVVRAVNPTHGQIKDLLNRLGIVNLPF